MNTDRTAVTNPGFALIGADKAPGVAVAVRESRGRAFFPATEIESPARRRRRIWLTLAAAFLAYSALSVLFTFPLILNLSSSLPKDLGDPLLTASILSWNAHVVPLTERWWNGFGFFPATGMMAFSEHFLGAALIAAPVQWLGLSAITAYNLTFLASFPLCGVAAHALALTVTRRHDAAAVCGLAYAFSPYRVAHVEHLELLLAFGMPAALAALHLYVDRRRAKWLVAFAAALTIQMLSASYYALFFTVFLGLWIIWFLRPYAWRDAVKVILAAGAAALCVSPIVLGYDRIHDHYNVTRDFTEEVLKFSGDVTSFVTASPLSAVWGWTAGLNGGERQLFPGITITALAVIGAILSWRRSRTDRRGRLATLSKTLWVISIAYAGLAIWTRIAGPSRVEWGWLTVSVSAPYKPISLSVACAIGAMALSPTVRAACRRRSVFAFYLVAALLLFLCSLGPRPTFLGEQVLYEPPYAWLMRLPLFGDRVRVPARFAMLGILALSVAASLAFHHLTSRTRQRFALLVVVIAGILADGWIRALPLPAVPGRGYQIPAGHRPAAVIELPLGDVWRDSAALYRATLHEVPAINGYNGYEPSYYQVLRRALDERDATILEALASFGPLLIATDNRVAPPASWAPFLSNRAGIRRVSDGGDWTLFQLPLQHQRPLRNRCGAPLAIAAAFDVHGQVEIAGLTDQDPATRWITEDPRLGDALILDLGRLEPMCGLVVSIGPAAVLYPGTLSVATSPDRVAWDTGVVARMGGPAFRAALEDPRHARVSISLHGKVARFIRLRLEESQPLYPWAVADLAVEHP